MAKTSFKLISKITAAQIADFKIYFNLEPPKCTGWNILMYSNYTLEINLLQLVRLLNLYIFKKPH